MQTGGEPIAPQAPAALQSRNPAKAETPPASEEAPSEKERQPMLEGTRELAKNLEKGSPSGQGPALERAYTGSARDHALLGPTMDIIVTAAEKAARAALAKPRPAKRGEKPAPPRPVTEERIWAWLDGSQSFFRLPILQWIEERRASGQAAPPGWSLELLEFKLNELNAAIRTANKKGPWIPQLSLEGLKVLVDDLSDGLRTRATIRQRLRDEKRFDLRRMGAFNLFTEKVISEDLLLSPETKAEDLLAILLHETLAATGFVAHEEVVEWVRGLTEIAFNLGANRAMTQRRMETLVQQANAWAEGGEKKSPAGPKAEPEPEADVPKNAENPFDIYVPPFDLRTVRVSGSVGSIEQGRRWQVPFETAFLRLRAANGGLISLGIGREQNPPEEESDADAPRLPPTRSISLWYAPPQQGAKSFQIAILPGGELLQRAIHAQSADTAEERDPGPMISRSRFYYEMLEPFDRAVRTYLEDPKVSAAAANFVEQVYSSFRFNFGRDFHIELDEFTFRRPLRRPAP